MNQQSAAPNAVVPIDQLNEAGVASAHNPMVAEVRVALTGAMKEDDTENMPLIDQASSVPLMGPLS